jgi:hypothetical protein
MNVQERIKMPATSERQESYRAAIQKASAWLAHAQRPDGSFGPAVGALGDIETAAICLQLTGYPEHAYRLLRYIRTAHFRVDGSFYQPVDEGTLAEWLYAPSWTVVSAHLNGFFDLSLPAMDAILRFQDPKTGGLFGHPQAQRRGEGVIMPTVTAVAGEAAIVTGRLAEARRIGDYLLHLIASQPDLDQRFYPFYDTRSGLITEGTPELGPTYFGAFERNAPKQHYWLPGLLMAVLADLYLATGEKKYLDGAGTIFEFGEGCHDDLYANTLNHKYLWGCVRLYHATGDLRPLETAMRIADFLARVQEPDGTWWHSGFIPVREQQPPGATVDVTSQFCIWLVRLLQVL